MGRPDDAGDLVPLQVAVEAHAQPAAVADVGRPEEPLGVGLDHRLLGADRGRAPQRQRPVAVVVIPDLRELAPADEPGGRAVAQTLLGSRQRQADRAQPPQNGLVQSPAAASWAAWGAAAGM